MHVAATDLSVILGYVRVASFRGPFSIFFITHSYFDGNWGCYEIFRSAGGLSQFQNRIFGGGRDNEVCKGPTIPFTSADTYPLIDRDMIYHMQRNVLIVGPLVPHVMRGRINPCFKFGVKTGHG